MARKKPMLRFISIGGRNCLPRSSFGLAFFAFLTIGAAAQPTLEMPAAAETVLPFTQQREVEQLFPVRAKVNILINNEFGDIQVRSWDEGVVEMRVVIRTAAAVEDLAARMVERIEIAVEANPKSVAMRTQFPPLADGNAAVAMEVHYTVMVPRDASVTAGNSFGDTRIQDVGGAVTVQARYGAVDLMNLGAPVRLDSQGSFPVTVQGLPQGGVFALRGAPANLSDVGGALELHSFRGEVRLSGLAEKTELHAEVDSASLYVSLPTEAQPDLTATTLFGQFNSPLPTERRETGNCVVARSRVKDAGRRLRLHASFGDIHVTRTAEATAPAMVNTDAKDLFTDLLKKTAPLPNAAPLIIHSGLQGNVRVEGADVENVRVTATRSVWVDSASQAPAALEDMGMTLGMEDDALSLRTTALESESAMLRRRIDVTILCPRTTQLEVHGGQEDTSVEGLDGPLVIRQQSGQVRVERVKDPIDVTNAEGGVALSDCGGPVLITASQGAVRLSRVSGTARIANSAGPIVIETPKGEVIAHNEDGDIRVLADEGLRDNLDLGTEKGSISLVLSPKTSGAISAKTIRGEIKSTTVLTGTLAGEVQEFHGRLGTGQYRIQLEAMDGNIAIY
jgi:hypothetical protein